jgi:hypothetical protein
MDACAFYLREEVQGLQNSFRAVVEREAVTMHP